jgi:hypothetical protein
MTRARAVVIAVFAAALPGQTEIGSPAPPLRSKDWVRGPAIDLAAESAAGRAVLLQWVPPNFSLDGELDVDLRALRQAGKGKLAVVACVDGSRERWLEFTARFPRTLDYPLFCDDDRRTATAYFSAAELAWPCCALIAPDGRLLWVGCGRDASEVMPAVEQALTGKPDFERWQRLREAERIWREEGTRSSFACESVLQLDPGHVRAGVQRLQLLRRSGRTRGI